MKAPCVVSCFIIHLAAAAAVPRLLTVDSVLQTRGVTVRVSGEGAVTSVALGEKKIPWRLLGQTQLAGCRAEGGVARSQGEHGAVRFTKSLACTDAGTARQVELIETFSPTPDSIRWEIELKGHGSPWSTPIETRLQFADARSRTFWTAWGDPRPEDPWVQSTEQVARTSRRATDL